METVISDVMFKKFSDLVMNATGINLHLGKKQLLQARVSKIMRRKGLTTFKQYYDYLEKEPEEEMIEFVNAISTNVTFFFREEKHFEFLTTLYEKNPPRNIKIWSAACSSGEEPYSTAITLLEAAPQAKIELFASDISTKMLAFAQKGIYPIERVERIQPHLLHKYFKKGTGRAQDYVMVKPEVKNLIKFRKINLIEPVGIPDNIDVVFCRNVMIYFKAETKKQIVRMLFRQLKPGGYLFIGHSETLNGITRDFEYVTPAVYRKPS